ncbi:hypothetical protein M885DRAFT_576741 [Pelagophyceae sp. CCMP2097]|nr:hypothetical protein M885DRAFT_576741 [Pelagophyceae sp. CCMP2097]
MEPAATTEQGDTAAPRKRTELGCTAPRTAEAPASLRLSHGWAFDVINRMRLSSMPLEALRAHVGATRGTADAVGPDWSAVLRLVDVVGVNTLERAAPRGFGRWGRA